MSRPVKDPRTRLLPRFVRGRQFDQNPLRRTSDRVETAVLLALLIAFSIGAPLVAAACGGLAHGIAERNMTAQRASRYQVTATVLAAATASQPGDPPEPVARWTAPDGRVVTGQVPALGDVQVAIWVTRDGQLTTAPLVPSQVAGQTDLAEVLGGAGLAAVLAGAGLLARRALDKRRMAGWDAEWQASHLRDLRP